MFLRKKAANFLNKKIAGKRILDAYRLRRRQKDWSRKIVINFKKTSLVFFHTIGLGDTMIASQYCKAFEEYCKKEGDPKLGKIVFNAGDWSLDFKLERGDINFYWWWSMNFSDSWLDDYISNIDVKPDIICCLSMACLNYAEEKGFKAFLYPLGAGSDFKSLNLDRAGIGYAGLKNQKDAEQEDVVLGPFINQEDFEWVHNLRSAHELNLFYNKKKIILGMTERYQEKFGMVNNRVFEALASATPFIIYKNRGLIETLGFEYPYQTNSFEQTKQIADEILKNYSKYKNEFICYSRIIAEKHSYYKRIKSLVEFIKE